jgi:hypothetical protein
MAGAYTLSRNGHVRGDVLYRLWPPRVQASVELGAVHPVLLPRRDRADGLRLGLRLRRVQAAGGERQQPGGRADLAAEDADPVRGRCSPCRASPRSLRCVQCLRDGHWPPRLHDVEELEDAIARGARRSEGEAGGAVSDPVIALVMLGLFIFIIMLGFPIAFTLMAMGVMFGYYAYFSPTRRSSTTACSTC